MLTFEPGARNACEMLSRNLFCAHALRTALEGNDRNENNNINTQCQLQFLLFCQQNIMITNFFLNNNRGANRNSICTKKRDRNQSCSRMFRENMHTCDFELKKKTNKARKKCKTEEERN